MLHQRAQRRHRKVWRPHEQHANRLTHCLDHAHLAGSCSHGPGWPRNTRTMSLGEYTAGGTPDGMPVLDVIVRNRRLISTECPQRKPRMGYHQLDPDNVQLARHLFDTESHLAIAAALSSETPADVYVDDPHAPRAALLIVLD